MKLLLVSSVLFLLFLTSCKEKSNPLPSEPDNRKQFEINFLLYSDNNYFIDAIYADTSEGLNMYNLYYGEMIPEIVPKYLVKNIEVFISSQGWDSYESFEANAYIDLPSRSASELYSDSLRTNVRTIPGKSESLRFRLLSPVMDYVFVPEIGLIKFLFTVPEQEVITVAYKIENDDPLKNDDLIYGEFISELISNSKTSGVLKLIKPKNLQPVYKDAWNLKLKNHYKIPNEFGAVANLELDIFLKRSDGYEVNKINDVGLLALFGLDRFSETGSPAPDGKFDVAINRTFIPQTSEIIFPVVEPFGRNIPPSIKDYKHQEIYDTLKSLLALPQNSFVVRGKFTPK